MRLGYGIFLGYLLIALLAGYFVLNVFVDEIKPSARQSMEDSLVDAANLLAEFAVSDLQNGQIQDGVFANQVSAYKARELEASIWGFSRTRPSFRIYVTDARGIVRYDSDNKAVGEDYSRWNDVYLTLKGQYGVRSSPDPEADHPKSTTMYVAAPIQSGPQILGVLTVAKSNLAIDPFIERTRNKIVRAGSVLLTVSLLIGLAISYWLSASIHKLVSYAEAVSRGERAVLPAVSLSEVKRLGISLQSMRERLEGKRYVEEYIGTLTHEMKSPLTAIHAATELLSEPMPEAQRQTFIQSISDQTKRLRVFIEKMLEQASLENRQSLDSAAPHSLFEIITRAIDSISVKLQKKQLNLTVDGPQDAVALVDSFLIEQALLNILDNALDFSPEGGRLHLSLKRDDNFWCLSLEDQGPGIPEYAKDKIFDRYYSLPRPNGNAKSTGLGLAFVKQVMELHRGRVEIEGRAEGGTVARLYIPA